MKLEIEPFKVGDLDVTEVTVRTLGFIDLVSVWSKSSTAKGRQRAQMQAMVRLNGQEPTIEQITKLPIKVAKRILAGMNKASDTSEPGQVLSDGADGIDTPILYKLGTPLRMKRGKEDVFITELEFKATTYDEIEDVIAAENDLAATVELIKRLAVPVGVKNLNIVPEATLSQLTMSDGMKMAIEVLAPFVALET